MAEINSISSIANSKTNSPINPKSILGKDDFLKLLITQLRYQDPTSPMDSSEILTQNSQLATIETQQNINKALEKLAVSFAQTKDFTAVSAIGKFARLDNKVTLKENDDKNSTKVKFDLTFDEDIKEGTISIYDENSLFIKSIPIEKNTKGTHSYTWDGTNSAGEKVKSGEYTVIAKYTNNDGVNLIAQFPSYQIESVKFDNEKTYVKLNGNFIDFKHIQEIYNKA